LAGAIRTRRGFLKLAGSIAVGASVLLLSDGLLTTGSLWEDVTSISAAANGQADNVASLITVKVYYSMMTQYIESSEEEFVLQSPATIQNLIATCIVRHPSVAQMIGTMMILLNGVPSKPSSSLSDGDTVQFIPLSGGG